MKEILFFGCISAENSRCDVASVLNLLGLFGTSRRLVLDDKLLQRLVEMQIPLTVCRVSNIQSKIFPDLAAHPLKRLTDAGVFVTINSDNPPMFHADVVDNICR